MTRQTKSAALSAIVGLALTACATPALEYRKGAIGSDHLMTYRVVSREDVQRECPSAQDVIGCARVVWREIEGRSVGLCRISVIEGDAPELTAHEICHCVAALNGVRDSCHDVDGGKTATRDRWRRRP